MSNTKQLFEDISVLLKETLEIEYSSKLNGMQRDLKELLENDGLCALIDECKELPLDSDLTFKASAIRLMQDNLKLQDKVELAKQRTLEAVEDHFNAWLTDMQKEKQRAVAEIAETNSIIAQCKAEAEGLKKLLGEENKLSKDLTEGLTPLLDNVEKKIDQLNKQNDQNRLKTKENNLKLQRMMKRIDECIDELSHYKAKKQYISFIFSNVQDDIFIVNRNNIEKTFMDFLLLETLIKEQSMFYTRMCHRMCKWEDAFSPKEIEVLGKMSLLAVQDGLALCIKKFHKERVESKTNVKDNITLLIKGRNTNSVTQCIKEYENSVQWKKNIFVYRALRLSFGDKSQQTCIPNYYESQNGYYRGY